MRAGLLKDPVTFLARVPAETAFGLGGDRWEEVRHTRGRLVQEAGTLANIDGEPFYREKVTLTVRIYHDIEPEWRVRAGGVLWQQALPPRRDDTLRCQYLTLERVNE